MIGPFYDPFKGAGRILSIESDKIVWIMEDDEKIVTCVQRLADPIIENNKQELADNSGERWGDGQVVASIPLDMYFEKFATARMNGDENHIKKLLNDSDYRFLRTFPGKV